MKNVLILFMLLVAVPIFCQDLQTLPVSKYKTDQVFYKTFHLKNQSASSIFFTPDSKEILFNFSEEKHLDFMDPVTGAITRSLPFPQELQFLSAPLNDHVFGCIFSESGIYGEGASTVYLYDFKTGTFTDTIPLPEPIVGFVCLEQGKKLLTLNNDLSILDRTTGVNTHIGQNYGFDPATRMVVSTDEKWLFMRNDFRFQVWKIDQMPALKVLDRHSIAGYCLAEMSPDGRYVSWHEATGNLYVYEMATEKTFTRLGIFSGLHYTPDSRQLIAASGGNNNIEVLQLPELTTVRKIQTPVKTYGFKVSPNGRTAMAFDDSSVQLWNLGAILDNELDAKMPPLREDTTEITFFPQPMPPDSFSLELYRRGGVDEWHMVYAKNGKRVAIPTFDYMIEIRDLPSGKLQMTISGSEATLALDPVGETLAYAPYDSTVYLLDLKQRKVLHSIKINTSEVRKMQFSDDGKKLAIAFGTPAQFTIVDVLTGKSLQKSPTTLSDNANAIWFSDDANFVSITTGKGEIETWKWRDASIIRHARLTEKNAMPFFSPNHKLLFYYKDNTYVEILDQEHGKILGQVKRPSPYAAAFFSADNSMLYFIHHHSLLRYHIATSKSDTVQIDKLDVPYNAYGSEWSFAPYSDYLINTEFMRIWDLAKNAELPIITKHNPPNVYRGLKIRTCFSADGTRMYSVKDPFCSATVEVIAWNTITQQPEFSLRVPEATNKDLVLSSDDRYLAVIPYNTASDSIRIWDIQQKKIILSLAFNGQYRLAFSPDSKYIYTCDGYGKLRCFSLPKGEATSLPDATFFNRINDLLFSADHKHLLTVNTAGLLTLLEYPSLKQLNTMQANIGEAEFVPTALAADGTLVAGVVHGNEISIWDGVSGKLLRTLKGTSSSVFFTQLVFSPDNKSLYAAGTDEAVHVFDLKTGAFEYCIPQGYSVSDMAFIHNRPNILTVTGKGQVRFWDVQK